jgi:hypothetical protein
MSSLNCHRCGKICKSKGGLTNHLKSCIGKIKNNSTKILSKKDFKNIPENVYYKGRNMIINWSNSEKYKNIRRPGIYNGQYFASSEEQRNYFIDKSIGLIK